MKKLYTLILCFSLTYPFSSAQDIDLGVALGTTFYSGDLVPREFGIYVNDLYPSGGPFARFNFNRFLSVRTGFLYARVSGDDANYGLDQVRGLNFRSDIFELYALGEINLGNFGYRTSSAVFMPYLAAGGGVFYFNPQFNRDGEWIDTQPLGTEAQGLEGYPAPYDRVQYNLQLGAGVKLLLNERWMIGGELVGRYLFTDYLDDVGSMPVNYQTIFDGNGPTAAYVSRPTLDPGQENTDVTYVRGGEGRDWYYFMGLTLSFRLVSENVFYGPRKFDVMCPVFNQ